MRRSFQRIHQKSNFPSRQTSRSHIKHVRHNQSCPLFIEAIRWLSNYDRYNSSPVCVCVFARKRCVAPVLWCTMQTEPHTVAVVKKLPCKYVLPKGSCVETYYSCRVWRLLANQNREVETIEFTSCPLLCDPICSVIISLPFCFSI